jgi:hypothetical protein
MIVRQECMSVQLREAGECNGESVSSWFLKTHETVCALSPAFY